MAFSFDVILQAAQAVAPELFVLAEPDANSPQWFRVQTTNACRAVFAGDDQTRGAQQAEVLRDGRTAGPKIRGDLSNGVWAAAQQA